MAHPRLGVPIKLNDDRLRTRVLRTYRDNELEKFLGRPTLELVAANGRCTVGHYT